MGVPPARKDQQSAFARPGFVLVAIVLAGVVIAGVALLVTGGSNNDTTVVPGPSTDGQQTATGSDKREAKSDSVCGIADGPQDIPQGPPKTKWQLIGKMAAPSGAAGPGVVKDKLRTCYSHSPTGALLAAANFVATATVYGDDEKTMRALLADNPDPSIDEGDDEPDPDQARLQIVGFRVVGANRREATIELAFSYSDFETSPTDVSMTLPMRWENGDWKVVLVPGEDPAGQVLDGISGFIPWSGA